MAKIQKTWKQAGYAPGQYQKLTITYASRDGDDVKVNYNLYIKSKGYDYYSYNSRHNKFNIYHPKDTSKASGTYQAYGSHAVRKKKGSFTVHNVGNTTTKLSFWYRNKRVWPGKTNKWDPRSTGVVSKTKVGELSIPKNKLYSITFSEVITDKTYEYECYYDEKFTIPNLNLTNHYFEFKGWTKKSYEDDLFEFTEDTDGPGSQSTIIDNDDDSGDDNDTDYAVTIGDDDIDIELSVDVIESIKANSDYATGKKIKVTSDLDFYAVWRAKWCKYRYYDFNGNLIPEKYFSTAETNHKFGSETKLPNFNKIRDGFYKVPGYDFQRWVCSGDTYASGAVCDKWPSKKSTDNIVYFKPSKDNSKNKVKFYIQSGTVLEYEYYTDDKFNMERPLLDLGKTELTINPGYNLMGWITFPPKNPPFKIGGFPSNGIAFPNQAFNLDGLKTVQSTRSKYYEQSSIIESLNNKVSNDIVPYSSGDGFNIYWTSGNVIFDYTDFTTVEKDPTTGESCKVLQLYPYYEYYTTSYVYTNGQWRLAMPYVYKDGKWQMALSYVYTQDGNWKL